ncbi:MAG: adenylate cyclase [Hyphomicrobiaceae bacterium]
MQERNGRSAGEAPANSLPLLLPGEVRDQLARILESPEFVVPNRTRSFLRYLVEQTLAGRADRLKGYTIGTMVFGRDANFDSQADPVVRTEAGRLRRALERYYLVAGQADPVLLEVPKGGYVPLFSRRAVLEPKSPAVEEPVLTRRKPAGRARWQGTIVILVALAALMAVLSLQQMRLVEQPGANVESALPGSPTLLVMPFASLGEGNEATLYAVGVTEEILTKLSRFKDLAVQEAKSAPSLPATPDPQAIARELSARYLVTGSLRLSGPEIRVTSRLVDIRSGTVLWARTYEENLSVKELFTIQENIAQQVATAIAQPYGLVFRSELQRTADQPPNDLEAYACTLRFYVYRANPSPELHTLVRKCLEGAVARFPGYATAWAMLSLVALDEDRFAFNVRPGVPGPIERALQTARRAIDLDADNARGLQALMMALFFRGEVDEAERVGELAVAANPQDSELLSEFGLRVAMAGQWQRGRELVERALIRDPAYSSYCHAVLALIAYMQRDSDRAEAEIRQANLIKFSLYHAIAAVIYADRGLMAEARWEAAQFTELHPSFVANLDLELRKRNLRPEDRARLVQDLLKAGVPAPVEAFTAASRPPGGS